MKIANMEEKILTVKKEGLETLKCQNSTIL